MESNQTPEKIEPKIYQAFGIISGILEIAEGSLSSLLVGNQIYSVKVSSTVREKHQPGKLQNFKIYPAIINGSLGFSLRFVTRKSPAESGIILKGCWEIYEEEPRLIIYRNRWTRCKMPTVLPLIWEEAPLADGQYWEIEAELKGDKFEVIQAIGAFDPPRKYEKRVKKTFTNIKSDLPPPIIQSAKTAIVGDASQAIDENNLEAIALDVIESIAPSESKVITEAIAEGVNVVIELEEPDILPLVVETVTPKKKRASSKKTPASKKLPASSELEEPKKDKAKSTSSKKQTSTSSKRLFLGKQLPSGE